MNKDNKENMRHFRTFRFWSKHNKFLICNGFNEYQALRNNEKACLKCFQKLEDGFITPITFYCRSIRRIWYWFFFCEDPSMTQIKESKRKRRSFSQMNFLVPNEVYRVAVRGFNSKVKLLNILWYAFIVLYTLNTLYTWYALYYFRL